jgi:large subunit ribosomal protein L13
MRTTYMAKPHEIKRRWYIIDAAGRSLGRVATDAARLLRGKHKPEFTPHLDTGDHVVIINAGQVVLTGKKLEQKFYYRHSGYPGGLKKVNYATIMEKKPEQAVLLAVRGMLPHNKLGRAMLKKLRVYKDDQHAHHAQNPVPWGAGANVQMEGGPDA